MSKNMNGRRIQPDNVVINFAGIIFSFINRVFKHSCSRLLLPVFIEIYRRYYQLCSFFVQAKNQGGGVLSIATWGQSRINYFWPPVLKTF